MANGFFTMSPRRKRKIQAEMVKLFCVTARFSLHLKLHLLSALQIKQATFSVGVFFKVLL